MKKSVEIIYAETELLIVTGYYSAARSCSNDRIDPPEEASFEIDEVIFKDVDITKILSDDQCKEIEERCLEIIEN